MNTRKCPGCNKDLHHTNRNNCEQARKKNRLCVNCSAKKRALDDNWQKNVKEGVKKRALNEKWRQNVATALRQRNYVGELNPFYGKTHTQDAKDKMGLVKRPKSEEWRRRQSEAMSGEQNPNYGVSNYQRWLVKFGREKADELDANYRKKQSELCAGSGNPMYGKPTPQGSGNGWSGWYKGWYFRSLRDLSYMVGVIEVNNLKWRTAETNDLKIHYKDWKGASRTYKADFLIEEKLLVEVKPTKLKSSVSVKLKREAAELFCKQRGLEYKIEDVDVLSEETIRNLYLGGAIKFTERYDEKFRARYLR